MAKIWLAVRGSWRNTHSRMATWGSMVLLMMLASTAVRVRKAVFHNVKAKAVFTIDNQAMMSHWVNPNPPKPWVIQSPY